MPIFDFRLTMGGGGSGPPPPFLAAIICEQPLTGFVDMGSVFHICRNLTLVCIQFLSQTEKSFLKFLSSKSPL